MPLSPIRLLSHRQGMQAVQQRCAPCCADGQVAAAGAEGQAVHIAQRRARGGPVGEHCIARKVHKAQSILGHPARHCQNLHRAFQA